MVRAQKRSVRLAAGMALSVLLGCNAGHCQDLPWAIEDLTGAKTLPPHICQTPAPYCLVLADRLDLTKVDLQLARGDLASKNLIILADVITVSGQASFDLSGAPLGNTLADRTGGSLAFLARDFRLEREGQLTVNTRGGYVWNGPAPPGVISGQLGGNGGSFLLAADNVRLAPESVASFAQDMADAIDFALQGLQGKPFDSSGLWKALDLGYPKPEADALFDRVKDKTVIDDEVLKVQSLANHAAILPMLLKSAKDTLQRYFGGFNGQGGMSADFGKPWGTSGTFTVASSLNEGLSRIQRSDLAQSKWLLASLQTLQYQIADAVRANDISTEFQLYDYYGHLPPFNAVPSDRAVVTSILQALNTQRTQLPIALAAEQVTVKDQLGFPHQVDVYKILSSGTTYIGPTGIAILPVTIAGSSYAGISSYDPTTPNIQRLSFSAVLTFDPWLSDGTAKEIENAGGTFGGSFDRWNLQTTGISVSGVPSAEIRAHGNLLMTELSIDTENPSGIVALTQLMTNGLPLDLSWTYSLDTRIAGTLNELFLTFSRQAAFNIQLTNGLFHNSEKLPISVSYDRTAVGFQLVTPAMFIGAGQQASLGSDPGLTVPFEAMSFDSLTAAALTTRFFPVNGSHLVDEIRVSNDLGGSADSGDELLYVKMHLTSGRAQPVATGDYRLPPRPAPGSITYMPAYRLADEARFIRVEGFAHYRSGADRPLRVDSDGLTIAITSDAFSEGTPK